MPEIFPLQTQFRLEEVMSTSERRKFLKLAGVGAALAASASAADVSTAGAPDGAIFDVRKFGAAGDGKTVDTAAINKTIDAAASAAGGTVYFPAGSYLSFSIHLKSNIALHLDRGATVIGAETPAGGSGGYDLPEPNQWDHYQDFGHSHFHNSLIWGEGLENVSILGPGRIWGKGLSKGYGPGPNVKQPGVGNKSISLKNCHNVLLRDFSILQGGWFGILATGVDNFTIDNLTVDTNRDGMDIDCCRNVRVSNCTVNSPWDDGICPKSSYALGYPRATEMVTITNCFVTGGYELGTVLDGTYKVIDPAVRIPRTGRIKMGTESNGGFKNITISNCVFEKCGGLALETVDGAILEDVSISNITMRDITNSPIFLRLGSRMRGPEGRPMGVLRRVIISNVVCSNSRSRFGCIISGIPGHYIEDVKLSDMYLQFEGGGTKEDAALQAPEKENGYPEPTMFGTLPDSGFFIRHVKNIDIGNVEISSEKPDQRPPFVLDDVQGAEFLRIKTPQTAGVPAFALNNVSNFSVYSSKPVADTQLDHAAEKKL